LLSENHLKEFSLESYKLKIWAQRADI
jgi:hypothetical protein